MDLADLAEPIELPSNSSRRCMWLRARQAVVGGLFIADVELTAEEVELSDSKGVPSGRLLLKALPFDRTRLAELSAALQRWLTAPHSFEVTLVDDDWGSFTLAVGADARYIGSREKPSCRIVFRWCGIVGDFQLVVDESCLRIFHEGVDGWLRLRRGTE